MPGSTSPPHLGRLGRPARLLVVAAHPDDETIGCGGLLAGLRGQSRIHIVHVTDGAPRDKRFVPSRIRGHRESYARLRRGEAARALELAHISKARLYSLGAVDQEASFELVRLIRALVELLDHLKPDIVITHPYEGGHPDHDASCFIAHSACDLASSFLSSPPRLIEMSSYHGAHGHLVTGSFLPISDATTPVDVHSAEEVLASFLDASTGPLRFVLPEELRALKASMMRCFESQEEVLRDFEVDDELFRDAPRYVFARAPHEGMLHYERLGWPMTGEVFRRCVALAKEAFGQDEMAWL